MISIAKHIETLLLEHDCVIVPGFGGFIANHADAKYDENSDSLFLPPYRTIAFNQQLQVNDGLLVQSYMNAYDASYPAAYLQMEKDIDRMTEQLDAKGEYELEGIGTLKKSINQNITFTTGEAGILTPAFYGLYSFEMKSIESVLKDIEIEKALNAASSIPVINENNKEEQNRKDVVIRLRRRWIDFSISAAAAVLLFICFSYPALHSSAPEGDTIVASSISNMNVKPAEIKNTDKTKANKTEIATTTNPKIAEVKDAKATQETKANNTKSAEPASTDAKNAAPAPKASEMKFSIVLASYVGKTNAENFINNLSKKGLTEGRYVKDGKISRILYSGYASESEAQSALVNLRKEASEFSEGWVIEL
ncbi:MAG: SPOR domain-containing protein [Prevotellaceae bacterium]|nr:SPOR domain-containing protein [Candidatus Minthosoma caballi]